MEYSKERRRHKILTIPNVLSFFRLCLIPLIIWQYAGKHNYLISICLLVLSGLTDIADGIIARKFNMVSDFGKALDPVADKLTQIAVLFCLIARFPNMRIPLILLTVKEIFAGITGLMMVKKGIINGAAWHGKVTTALLYGAMLLHMAWANILPAVSDIMIGICTGMIILSGILYGIQNVKCLCWGGDQHEKN